MCVCSPKTLVKIEELPKFNGKRITSIYAEYENSRHGRGKDNNFYVADVLFYKCYIHDWDIDKNENRQKIGKSYFKIKQLPKEFDGLFGKVTNKGKNVFVTNMWFRTSDSANGSFTDQTLDLGGWAGNGTTSSFGLFRGIDYVNTDEHTYAISEGSELAKKLSKVLGGSFKVKEIEFTDCGFKMKEGSLDFATKYPYPHTPIRYIDGLVYPDEKLPSWRWHYGMPYRQPTGQTDRKSLRVWDQDLQMHFYLEKTEKIEEGEEGLVSINFPYDYHEIYGSKGNAYCQTTRYNESCNYVWQTYTVTKVTAKGVVCDSYRGTTKMKSGVTGGHTDFYRIVKRVESSEKQKKDDYQF